MSGNVLDQRIMFMHLCISIAIDTYSKTIGPELFRRDNISYNEVFVQLKQDWVFL